MAARRPAWTNAGRGADLVDVAQDVKTEVQKWLVVLARCFELHDAVAVLELDRVLDASPDELDKHLLGLKSARQDRLNLISERTEYLLGRMNAAVAKENSKVLFNPKQSPAVVESSNSVAADVLEFHDLLGIESGRESSEAKRWMEAAGERWDKARATSAQGVDGLKRFGGGARDQAGSMRHKLTDPRNGSELGARTTIRAVSGPRAVTHGAHPILTAKRSVVVMHDQLVRTELDEPHLVQGSDDRVKEPWNRAINSLLLMLAVAT